MIELERYLTKSAPTQGGFRNEEDPLLVPLEVVRSRSMTLIVAAPGAGKSFLLNSLAQSLVGSSTPFARHDLLSMSELGVRDLGSRLHVDPGPGGVLLLDGLDESRARFTTLIGAVEAIVANAQDSRVHVVATCRSAELQSAIERLFNRKGGSSEDEKTEDSIYHLAPLSRADVATACRADGLDADAFLTDVANAGVESLASIPYTLELLLEHSKGNSTLGTGRAELYEAAVRRLLNKMRLPVTAATRSLETSEETRRAFAGQLALTLVFSRTRTIPIDEHDGVVCLSSGFAVVNPDRRFNSTEWERAGNEVLSSGLVQGGGTGELLLAHRSLLDYLAARQFVDLELDSELASQLLTLTGSEGLLPTELVPVATWLLILTSRFDWIAPLEPLRFIKARTQDEAPRLRASLLGSLLDDAERWELEASYSTSFSGLDYEALPARLAAALECESKAAQRLALRILADNSAPELLERVRELALDDREDGQTRQLAVDVLRAHQDSPGLTAIADSLLKGQLVAGEGLLGAVLEACWPEFLDTKDVLGLLKSPQPHFLGRYKVFLHTFVSRADEIELQEIFLWAASNTLEESPAPRARIRRRKWCRQILLDALSRLPQSTLFELDNSNLAMILLAVQGDDGPLDLGLGAIDESRRQDIVIRAIKDGFARGMRAHEVLEMSEEGQSILNYLDLTDLLDLWTSGDLAFANLVKWRFDPSDPEHVDAIRSAKDSELVRELKDQVDASESRSMKGRSWRHRARPRAIRREAPLGFRDLRYAVRKEINAAFADPRRFWMPFYLLSADKETGQLRDLAGEDYRDFELYGELPELDVKRLRKLAERFLQTISVETLPPYGAEATYSRVHHSAYQILYVAFLEGSSILSTISDTGWKLLVDSVVRFPVHFVNGPGDRDSKVRLLELLREKTPDELNARVEAFVDLSLENPSRPIRLTEVAALQDPQIATQLTRAVDALAGHERSELLAALVSANPDSPFATQSISHGSAEDVATVVNALLDTEPTRGTNTLRLVIDSRPDIAGHVLEQVAVHERFSSRIQGPVDLLLALYLLTRRAFPPESDPALAAGVYTVTPRHDVADLRRHFLSSVIALGTRESHEAIMRLREEAPAFVSPLDVIRSSAEYKANGWVGTSVDDLQHSLTYRRKGLLARDVDEVLENVMKVLAQVERELSPPKRLGRYLWLEKRPRIETDLSDWYQHELAHRLSAGFINREVQVGSGRSGTFGDRTDLQIDVMAAGQERTSVFIEVKGSWHPEVLTALNAQLVDRYLIGEKATHGIYLVGWFDPEERSDDARPSPAERLGLEQTTQLLNDQATSVEAPRRVKVCVHSFPR